MKGVGRGGFRDLATGRSGAFKDLSLNPKEARKGLERVLERARGCGCPLLSPEAPLPLRTTVLAF